MEQFSNPAVGTSLPGRPAAKRSNVGTVDIEQVNINRGGSCFVAPSDEGAPEG